MYKQSTSQGIPPKPCSTFQYSMLWKVRDSPVPITGVIVVSFFAALTLPCSLPCKRCSAGLGVFGSETVALRAGKAPG